MRFRPFIRLLLFTLIVGGVWSARSSASAAHYIVSDLGTLGGDSSRATDINGTGQIVGVSRTADGSERAFLWQNGEMKDLGTLGGSNSHATAINETGGIVGWAETLEGGIRACLFGAGTNMDLSGGHGNDSYAADINDHGRVVGWTETPVSGADQPRPTAVLFGSSPSLQFLSVWDGTPVRGRATAINNGSVIGGWTGDVFSFWGPRDRAAFWEDLDSSAFTRYSDIDSFVHDVDAIGRLVGESGLPYVWKRAALWSGTNQLSLGSLAFGSSTAAAINQAGHIVGSADAYRFGLITNKFFPGPGTDGPPPEPEVYEGYERTRHAFLWQNGVMSDLNDLIPTHSGWELTAAESINDAGQIVGSGQFNGLTRAFLLTPVANPDPIPFVRLISPADGDWVSGAEVTLRAEASDADGEIRRVEFFAQRVSRRDPLTGAISVNYPNASRIGDLHPPGWLGSVTNPPFTLTVTNLASGNYLILAKAFDDQGATACASEVLVRLNAPPRLHVVRGPAIILNPASTDKTLTLRLMNGNEEKSYDVEASEDLGTWTHVGIIWAPSYSFGGAFQISDPADSHRFYRVVSR